MVLNVSKFVTDQETVHALTVDNMLCKLGKQDKIKVDCQNLPREGRTVFQYSCYTEKTVGYSRAVGQIWMSHHCRKILATAQAAVPVISLVLEDFYFPLSVYSGNVCPLVSDSVDD